MSDNHQQSLPTSIHNNDSIIERAKLDTYESLSAVITAVIEHNNIPEEHKIQWLLTVIEM